MIIIITIPTGTSPPDMEEEEEEEEGKGKKEATVKVGDYIRVELEADIFKAMQEDQGGSNPIMISDVGVVSCGCMDDDDVMCLVQVLGTVGRVVSILDDGNLRARYSLDITWTICAEAVVKASSNSDLYISGHFGRSYFVLNKRFPRQYHLVPYP